MASFTLRTFVFLTLIGCCAQAKTPLNPVHMPLFLIRNAGQYAAENDYALNDGEATVIFRNREVVYQLRNGRTVRVQYAGTTTAHAHGLELLDGKVNFLIGQDESEWRAGVETYSSLAYRNMWPGIDVLYSVNSGRLKTEIQLAPGTDTETVRWNIVGADSVKVAADGSLVIQAGDQNLTESAPQVFEQDHGTGDLKPVRGAFRSLGNGAMGITTGPYDHQNRLIFDPVIGYSTYFGGTGQSGATAIAVDTEGNEIIAGYTQTLDIVNGAHTLGSIQREAAFVAKLTASGNQLIFCTYLGGTLQSQANALALDRFNNVYVAGVTNASNFPTLNALQPHINGAQDAFVAELNSTGSALIFSTFLGGSNADQANGLAVNRQGNIFVTGNTLSTNFPVVTPIQGTNGGGQDAFVVKLGVSGSNIMWSTYVGGAADESATAIAVDEAGSIIIAGSTLSTNFPVLNAAQPRSGGNQDAFVTKISSAGNSLVFSTYLGGSGGTPSLVESASALATDAAGSLYVSGSTSSVNFPVTPGAFQTVPGSGVVQAFAAKLSAAGALAYSTYLGGSSINYGTGIAVDMAGNAHVAGYTASPDFPNLHGLQPGVDGSYDMFITKLNATGSGLIYSTLLGGSALDSAAAIAVDRFANVLVTGLTFSPDFPVLGGVQGYLRGPQSPVIARIPVGWKAAAVTFAPNANWSVDSLRNGGTNGIAPAAQQFTFGLPGDIPIAGDWSTSGTQQVGVFRNGTWFLDINGNEIYDAADRSFVFGQAGDIPIVGDWTGSGTLKAGLYRQGTFILDLSGHLSGIPTGQADAKFAFGLATDQPVAGDWTGSGTAKVGVFRNGQWLLDWNGTHTINGVTVTYGIGGDIPVVGDWDGSGLIKIGVFRKGEFILDYNGNLTVDQLGDLYIPFGAGASYAMMMH